jgi:cell division protein FtsL
MDRVQTFTQAYSQAPWRKQLQVLGLFSLILVFVALVAGIYLNVTARAGEVGRDIQAMQRKMDTVNTDIADLYSQLAFVTSTGEMEKRALSLGFTSVNPEETIYMVVPGYTGRQPVILGPSDSPSLASAPVLPEEYTESLFEWVHRNWGPWSTTLLKVLP